MSVQQANPYAGYQLVVAVDISGSMNTKERAYDNQTRFQFVQQQIGYLAQELTKYDEDGLDVVLFNDEVMVKRGVDSPASVERELQLRPRGGTNTMAAVEACYKLHQEYKKQPGFKATLILMITDGEPSNREGLKNKLLEIGRKVAHQAEIGFSFLQVGDDREAKKFLQSLDDLRESRDYKDIVDTKSFEELSDGKKLSLAKVLADALND